MKLCRECRGDGTCPNMERIVLILAEHGCIPIPAGFQVSHVQQVQPTPTFVDQAEMVRAHVKGEHRPVPNLLCEVCVESAKEPPEEDEAKDETVPCAECRFHEGHDELCSFYSKVEP